jgi:hypothetical protein
VTADAPPAEAADNAGVSVRSFRPPGRVFFLVTFIAIVLAIDANSRESLSTAFLFALPLWVGLALVWLYRFVAAVRSGVRIGPADWVRWLAVPLAMGAVFLLTRTSFFIDARYEASRPGMDEMAADIMSGGTTERGWVGLYFPTAIERTANGVRFVVDEGIFQRHGYAYSPNGPPEWSEENFSPVFYPFSVQPLGDGWWLWVEAWD